MRLLAAAAVTLAVLAATAGCALAPLAAIVAAPAAAFTFRMGGDVVERYVPATGRLCLTDDGRLGLVVADEGWLRTHCQRVRLVPEP